MIFLSETKLHANEFERIQLQSKMEGVMLLTLMGERRALHCYGRMVLM